MIVKNIYSGTLNSENKKIIKNMGMNYLSGNSNDVLLKHGGNKDIKIASINIAMDKYLVLVTIDSVKENGILNGTFSSYDGHDIFEGRLE